LVTNLNQIYKSKWFYFFHYSDWFPKSFHFWNLKFNFVFLSKNWLVENLQFKLFRTIYHKIWIC
jgi:hypothetical protein